MEKFNLEDLRLLFLNILVYRLGGEVAITADDIEELCKTIDRTSILLVKVPDKEEHKFVLKTRLRTDS